MLHVFLNHRVDADTDKFVYIHVGVENSKGSGGGLSIAEVTLPDVFYVATTYFFKN